MKIVTFRHGSRSSYGVVTDGRIVDVGARLGQRFPTLRTALRGGALDEIRAAAKDGGAGPKLDEVTLLPVIPDAEKIICVGLNYEEHRKETGRDPTATPVLFIRFADTSVGHGQPMIKPKNSDKYDYEGELAVIIGKEARHISGDELSYIAGYSCFNDGSIRDWQTQTSQYTPGKNFPGTGGFGPWMVTADEIPDPTRLTLTTRLNGQEVQKSGTDMMIFDIPFVIRYISQWTTLRPGDVIATGTPGGVGMKRTPPLWMKPGDTVEVEITGVGTLRNPIVAE